MKVAQDMVNAQTSPQDDVAPQVLTASDHTSWRNCGEASLARRALDFLRDRKVGGIEGLVITEHGGLLVISGDLPNSDSRRNVFECCRRIPGVHEVIDRTVPSIPTVEMESVVEPIELHEDEMVLDHAELSIQGILDPASAALPKQPR